jgi:hypothetical protein
MIAPSTSAGNRKRDDGSCRESNDHRPPVSEGPIEPSTNGGLI